MTLYLSFSSSSLHPGFFKLIKKTHYFTVCAVSMPYLISGQQRKFEKNVTYILTTFDFKIEYCDCI